MSDQAIGNTPLVKIEDIYFKCEYKNPTGSHKDRAFVLQVSRLKKKGIKTAVLSSSGNAAISAANYCKTSGVKLTVFVSPGINKNKLHVLENLKCNILYDKKPVSGAVRFAKETGAFNLRQSVDPEASVGYETIAAEIIKENVIPDAIFLPVSSAATLVGIASGFKKLNYSIPMHVVQTDVVHPIAEVFDKEFGKTNEKSLADAIVAKFTPLEDKAKSIIRETRGSGWVIGNKEMRRAREWLSSRNLDCSYEGAAVLAALWKAKEKGYKFKNPVCILTGKFYS